MMSAFSLPPTLSRYLAKSYLVNLLFMAAILLGTIFMFDLVELLRRASKREDVSFMTVAEMGLLKLPEMALMIAPFIVLFSALFTFWQLTRRQEVVVLRSSGISIWQFLSPIILVALASGVFMVTIVNPVSALFYSRYTVLESTYLNQQQDMVAVFDEGLWLRQDTNDGYAILHAAKIDVPDWRLKNVMVLFFDEKDNFTQRIDAQQSLLKPGNWVLGNAIINRPGVPSEQKAAFDLPTGLTPRDIEDSFSRPRRWVSGRCPLISGRSKRRALIRPACASISRVCCHNLCFMRRWFFWRLRWPYARSVRAIPSPLLLWGSSSALPYSLCQASFRLWVPPTRFRYFCLPGVRPCSVSCSV